MRKIVIVCLAIIATAAPATADYGEMFNKIDIDKVLADDASFNEYIDCFLDKGPCSTDLMTQFRKIVPEVISTACEKCTTSEKVTVRKLVKAIYERTPSKAIELHKKYDPTGEHESKFAAFLSTKDD